MHLTAKTLDHVNISYFQFRKKTTELLMDCAEKALACALSSSAIQHKRFILAQMLALMHQGPTHKDFPWELRLWKSP